MHPAHRRSTDATNVIRTPSDHISAHMGVALPDAGGHPALVTTVSDIDHIRPNMPARSMPVLGLLELLGPSLFPIPMTSVSKSPANSYSRQLGHCIPNQRPSGSAPSQRLKGSSIRVTITLSPGSPPHISAHISRADGRLPQGTVREGGEVRGLRLRLSAHGESILDGPRVHIVKRR